MVDGCSGQIPMPAGMAMPSIALLASAKAIVADVRHRHQSATVGARGLPSAAAGFSPALSQLPSSGSHSHRGKHVAIQPFIR
jgi:hypothetical protein